MRIRTAKLITIFGVVVIGVAWGCALTISAAPPKSPAKIVSNQSADDAQPEIPAVPFLTLGLIRDPAVQAELGLDTKQINGVQAAIAQVDESFWRLRDVPVKNCSAELESLLTNLRRSLKLELNSSQLDRFDQIILQARNWKAIVTPEWAERLKLSSDQLSRIRILLADVPRLREENERTIAALSASSQEEARNRQLKAESKKFADVLTAQQQTQLSQLLGKPFDLDRVTKVGCVAPELRDVSAWINSPSLTLHQLRGKVVVVHFWAFGCINCIRNLPHYDSWNEKFAKSGLTIVGIHTPETESERSLDNLKRQVNERKIEYPIAFDASAQNWKAWANDMWPSVYLIDKQGRVRNWWYGELNWKGATGEELFRKRIEELLNEK
ncbi:MAG: redoxin domain-containing protein [Schlesneria sp.]